MTSHKTFFLSFLLSFLPFLIVLLVLFLANFYLSRKFGEKTEGITRKQVTMLLLTLVAFIFLIATLPFSEGFKGEVVGFVALLIGAATVLSSTPFFSNLLAGVLLRSAKSFRIGDFIQIQDHFGRVSARGLFHIEIQTEDGGLTTLPNLYLAANPLLVRFAAAHSVSMEVALGYEVPGIKAENTLIAGAEKAGLKEIVVTVVRLDDFFVTYRLRGRAEEDRDLFALRSRLNSQVLEALQDSGIKTGSSFPRPG
ncbi:MAG: mechanosensitive ion channel family protein [Deltaproteobacteria bacterium]|nr:mechanosensitive ion channel family protein [Deltaproteobacteria bacterium]